MAALFFLKPRLDKKNQDKRRERREKARRNPKIVLGKELEINKKQESEKLTRELRRQSEVLERESRL